MEHEWTDRGVVRWLADRLGIYQIMENNEGRRWRREIVDPEDDESLIGPADEILRLAARVEALEVAVRAVLDHAPEDMLSDPDGARWVGDSTILLCREALGEVFEAEPAPAEAPNAQIIDLMASLKASLAAARKRGGK